MNSPSSSASSTTDLHLFSDEHLRAQLESAPLQLGYKLVRFYADEYGVISKTPTEHVETFYLSPSGGTLRDKNMNIVMYSARYDMYKGIGKI
jgi:hypothetical protein